MSQAQARRRSGTQNADRPAKRSRVSRACDQCRNARERCDGVQPICSTCSASRRTCSYTTNPKKRGIQPGYIRTLELGLTWLFQNTEAETLLNQKLSREGNSSVLFGRDTKESNRLHKMWRKSRFCRHVDKLLSGEEIDQGDGKSLDSDEEESDAFLEDGNVLRQAAVQDEISPIGRSNNTTNHQSINHVIPASPSYPGVPGPPVSLLSTCQQFVCLPEHSWKLFDIYFAYTHCWLPICEKTEVLKLSYSYPEQGLVLSSDMPESGSHAELWSILAMASIQESAFTKAAAQQNQSLETPRQMYEVAALLIPKESGCFEMGHVRALLNLAVFNLSQSAPEAAWLLVGTASRVLVAIEQSSRTAKFRQKHAFVGCIILDNLLSLHLQRRPYLQKCDIDGMGKIDEDGLEEWQPWVGCLHALSSHNSRTPALSLSSFNHLLVITDILNSTQNSVSTHSLLREDMERIESWKMTLPAKFDYIRTEQYPTPLTPPAILLHLAFYCASLATFPSHSWVQRILELSDRAQGHFGPAGLPPVVMCLLTSVSKSSAFPRLDQRLQNSIENTRAGFTQEWLIGTPENSAIIQPPPSSSARRSIGTDQILTPESVNIPFHSSQIPVSNEVAEPTTLQPRSAFLDDLLPNINPATAASQSNASPQSFAFPPLRSGSDLRMLDYQNLAPSRDIESFFDDLASLDAADKVENQPQFMQNLGFAPDANMADFLAAEFSQHLPANSANFLPQDTADTTQFDHHTFYDTG